MSESKDIQNLRRKLKQNRKELRRYVLSRPVGKLSVKESLHESPQQLQKVIDITKRRTASTIEDTYEDTDTEIKTHPKDYKRITTIIKACIYVVFLIVIALLFYIITPLSTMTTVSISGNTQLTTEDIYLLSEVEIGNKMYFLNPDEIAKTLVQSPVITDAIVTKEGFNTLNIHITEQHTVAYISAADGFYPVKSNGYMALDAVNIPFYGPILYNFDEDSLPSIVTALRTLDDEILRTISEIYARPSAENINRIQLYMNDGQQVIADMSTLGDKISYYMSIRSEIDNSAEGLIDLEVGNSFLPYTSQEARELTASIYGESISNQERDLIENILEPLKAQFDDFSVQ